MIAVPKLKWYGPFATEMFFERLYFSVVFEVVREITDLYSRVRRL
jgi:hypothetical protein